MTLPKMPAHSPSSDAFGQTPRPPVDAASQTLLNVLPPGASSIEQLLAQRQLRLDTLETLQQDFEFDYSREVFTSFDGVERGISIFSARGPKSPDAPGFIYIHGGGMVAGSDIDVRTVLPVLARHGGTILSIDYRLAPEHPAPVPLEDCYAGVDWVFANARRFGINSSRTLMIGTSAGGGLALGTALLLRDRGGPKLLALQLDCPMLDDRCGSVSQLQFDSLGLWTRQGGLQGWRAFLGDAAGGPNVSPYCAPARATWLGGLPPVLLTVSSADPFRDEDTAMASAIWRDGGDCELYVTPGGIHGHDQFAFQTSIARSHWTVVSAWVERQLMPDPDDIGQAALAALANRARNAAPKA